MTSPAPKPPSAAHRSPIQGTWEKLSPTWGTVGSTRCPLHFDDPQREREIASAVALADLSMLRKVGVKGPGSTAWLRDIGLNLPDRVYGCHDSETDGLVARVDQGEFFIEAGLTAAGFSAGAVDRVAEGLERGVPGASRVDRQDAGLLLCGQDAHKVIEQTCGYDFEHGHGTRRDESVIVMTRVAAVSVAVRLFNLKPDCESSNVPAFRIWTAPSYGVYLWEALLEIVRDLGGGPVGLGAFGFASSQPAED